MRYKDLFRKLDRNLSDIQSTADSRALLVATIQRLVDDFEQDLGLSASRLYAREGDHYVLVREYPPTSSRTGFRIPASYEPIRQLLQHGFVLREEHDPDLDPGIETALGVATFAAICVGAGCEFVVAFSLLRDADREHVIYMLNTVRNVINLKLGKQRLEDRVAEVRAIQLSLLPRSVPEFGDFDVWAATVPAEEVGGDLYDYIVVGPRALGLAVVDSSGHGLPAALQARDAIIGLRMGVEERLRITATVEKLNDVIARGALASKFISMFYGELELNGTLVYCNAGHVPPLLFSGGRCEELTRGGRVLGPFPAAQYERGYVDLAPGDLLLAMTDGLLEAEDQRGRSFGTERIKAIVREGRWSSCRELIEAIFEQVRRFSGRATPIDDQTALAVRYRQAGRS